MNNAEYVLRDEYDARVMHPRCDGDVQPSALPRTHQQLLHGLIVRRSLLRLDEAPVLLAMDLDTLQRMATALSALPPRSEAAG